ncbi:retention module-containing protein [Campylobacter concisus]|uniref:RTX toxin n=1 Tax=Campylobacter concisus TaxID=199 RepID=A0A2R4NYC6_9BACT|nr:retention module-containing protein [Campylobacter concisus]AVX43428.1 hypothetical protein CCS77_0367 [Campylobacter concisus]
MSKEIGVVKNVTQGSVKAVSPTGESRELKVGDIVYQGEKIVTETTDAKVVIAKADGKEISLIGKDSINLDQSVSENSQTTADINSLQKAILGGQDLNALEETAAGGNQAGGNAGGDGVSLGAASFAQGGHYSNISANFSNLSSQTSANAPAVSNVRGGASAEPSDGFVSSAAASSQPVQPVIAPARAYITVDSGSAHSSEVSESDRSYPYMQYNFHIENAPAGSLTTNLKIDLGGQATKGEDYEHPEYSMDGGNTWTAVDPDMVLKNVVVQDGVIKFRMKVIDDYGQHAGNQNEGTKMSDEGTQIHANITEFGKYSEEATISISSDNGLISSDSASSKIVENDDFVKFAGDVDAEGKELNTGIGDDTIHAKEGDVKNINIKMGDGDDQAIFENHTIMNTTIDGGNGSDIINLTSNDKTIDTTVLGGNGDDVIKFTTKDGVSTGNVFDGGDGVDTLVIGSRDTFTDTTNTYKNFEKVDVTALTEGEAIQISGKADLAAIIDRFTNNGSHELTLVTDRTTEPGKFFNGGVYFWSIVDGRSPNINGGKPTGVTTEQDEHFYKMSFEHNGENYVLNVQNEIPYSYAITDYL